MRKRQKKTQRTHKQKMTKEEEKNGALWRLSEPNSFAFVFFCLFWALLTGIIATFIPGIWSMWYQNVAHFPQQPTIRGRSHGELILDRRKWEWNEHQYMMKSINDRNNEKGGRNWTTKWIEDPRFYQKIRKG